MFSFLTTGVASKNSWSGGSLPGSGFSTVKANSNLAIQKEKKMGDQLCLIAV